MSDLRIIDAPEIPTEEITGSEKLPTGGNGNYSISLDSVANHTKTSLDLANQTDVQTSSNGVKSQLDQHKNDLNNPHQVTKVQIGLENVDNTADADKPMSNAVQSAITTLTNNKADKTSVYLKTETYNKTEIDSALSTKPNSTTVYTKVEVNNLLNGKVTSVNGKTGTAITLNRSDLGISDDIVMQQWEKEARFVIDSGGENQQDINDKFSEEIPYSTFSYSNIQQAVDESPTGNTIHPQLKNYSESFDLNKNNFVGQGYGSILTVVNNSYGIKSLETTPNWDRMRITDISFKGQSRTGTTGFTFDNSNAFSGRRNIEYCTFDNLEIGIHKPKGNIGNLYSNLSFSNSNYGYRAKSSETPLMHAGNDVFKTCQFNSIDKWSIDLENTSGSDGFGQFLVDDSIFQFSSGGGIRIDLGNITPICPPIIRNTWFEEIAPPNTTVDRDGISEAPREIKLINAPLVFVEGCYLKNIELINSTMITKGCRIDSAGSGYNIIVKDSSSVIYADDVYMDGSISTNVTVRSVAKQKREAVGGDLTFLSTQIRSVTKNPSNSSDRIGLSFRNGIVGTTTWSITGSQTVTATCVFDGGDPVAKLPVQSGITNVIGNFGIHAGMWVVWGFSVKPLNNLTGTFQFKNDQNLGNITMITGQWTHNLGIAKVGTTGYISGWIQPTSNGDLLIKDYFCAEFANEVDALNFVNSRMSIDA